MQAPKVTIGVVLYRGEKYLKHSLPGLVNQDYPNLEILLRDQSPEGEAAKYIEAEIPGIRGKVKLEQGDNRWHSGGQNALISQMKGDYYICASNDMLYPPDFVSGIVSELEKPENRQYGSATCKLMAWDFENGRQTNKLDSCGIAIKPNHHFYDLGQGQEDAGQYDHRREIFGPSGALAIFRKEALNDIAFTNEKGETEYFDELIHYKNDVDLAYRLQWAGHKSLFIATVKVYHDRQAKNLEQSPSLFVRVLKARKGKARWTRESSFFGQQVTLLKNYSPEFSRSTRLKTNLYQWMSLGYASLFEPYLLKQFKKMKEHEAELDRKIRMSKRVAGPGDIEKLMIS